ncbi:MAG: hypothetical protein GX945_07170 [Lentisphaerae bacterium]|nr:hypothetical protein [Lentisphaerota bacterium]
MSKKIYLSFLLHGNMCYDRYTKHEIREKFPVLYAAGLRELRRFPQVTAHIDFPGLTTLSLKHHARWFVDELKPLVARKQVVMVGCQYGASHAMCSDEESDVLASRLGMQLIRDELQPDAATFFPQEIAFHSQMPYIMNQIGARRLIVAPPDRWLHPKRVTGIDGSQVDIYPLDKRFCNADRLEELYDAAEDGDFVLTGGDFEMLGNIEAYVRQIAALAEKGKIIEWTTVERYEQEVGIKELVNAPGPFGYTTNDTLVNPSFSRWVARPDDPIWHGEAVRAADALRTAGFAEAAAALLGLQSGNVPWQERWTMEPANPWARDFEHASEFPETESRYLAAAGPTVLSRAWHHLLIGLNSDSSGWAPWQPRTRHRMAAMRSSQALAAEVTQRFARQLAQELQPFAGKADELVLVLNPAPARTVEVAIPTDQAARVIDANCQDCLCSTNFRNGKWETTARVAMPAYGYALFGVIPAPAPAAPAWENGSVAEFAGRRAELTGNSLVIQGPDGEIGLSLPPFHLADPAGVAPEEDIVPTWETATARTRRTPLGEDLEVFLEVAWTVWLRLVIGLRSDRVEITAELTVDRPRCIGDSTGYNPEGGLLLQFRGQPGCGVYDIPYATIAHPYEEASFVAAQRFVGVEASAASFGVIALEGNQSFKLDAKNGTIGANLGASIKGRPDLRPECLMLPNGRAKHTFVTKGDPFFGTTTHRYALVFGNRTQVALAAHTLRTGTPACRVPVGAGERPSSGSFFDIAPATLRVTAFRRKQDGIEIVLNNLSAEPATARCNDQTAQLPAYGIATLPLTADTKTPDK